MMKSLFYGFMLVLLASVWPANGDSLLPKLRISLENTQTHVHTQAVAEFARDLGRKLKGKLDIDVYTNASLFRDRDIIQALAHGKVEMAVPGTWHITRFEPNVGIFLLPVFYGRSAGANYLVLDSDVGREINRRIETGLGLKVIGRWMDLGHAHLFGVNRIIGSRADLKDIRIRVAGGIANKLRIKALGAAPCIIAWPDLPEHMLRHRVDAVLTSYETIRSAKLWEKGITSVYEDMEYYPQYVPLIRNDFWSRLSPQVQETILETWERHLDHAREMAAQAQSDAKRDLIAHGVTVTTPDKNQLTATRNHLMTYQDAFARQTRIDPQLAEQVTELLND